MEFFAWAALFLAAAGFIPYLWATWRDRHNQSPTAVKASKSTWIIYLTLTSLIAGAMWNAGTLSGQLEVYVIGDILVLMIALPYGIPGWSRLDKLCLAGGAVGII